MGYMDKSIEKDACSLFLKKSQERPCSWEITNEVYKLIGEKVSQLSEAQFSSVQSLSRV